MLDNSRKALELDVAFASGETDSNAIDIRGGAFGTLIVPTGSALIGKTLQFVAVSQAATPKFTPVALFATPITIAAGANPLTTDNIREAGAASVCLLRVSSAVGSAAAATLLWKS